MYKPEEAAYSMQIREAETYIYSGLRGQDIFDSPLLELVSTALLAYEARNTGATVESVDSILQLLSSQLSETTLTHLKRVARQNHKQIDDLINKFDEVVLSDVILQAETERFTESDQHSTPGGIIDLAIQLLDISPDDVVLDLGSGLGSFLSRVAQTSGCTNLLGVELNTESYIIADIRRYIAQLPISYQQGNIVSRDYSSCLANKVFSDHPIGMKLSSLRSEYERNPSLRKFFRSMKSSQSGDWIFNMAAYFSTKQPGRTVVIMANNGTWNKADETIRQRLVEEGLVEGVILLPERLMAKTTVGVTMMIFSQNNTSVRMVDASAIYTEGRRKRNLLRDNVTEIMRAYKAETDISRLVPASEIAGQEYILYPQRYIDVQVISGPSVPLGDLALYIDRGAIIRSSELEDLYTNEITDYVYLRLQDIVDGTISNDLQNLIWIEDKYDKHCVANGNIVVSKTAPFKVALVDVDEGQMVLANGNLYLLQINAHKANPEFVELFLQSEAGLAQLNRYAKGGTVKSISLEDLRAVRIPSLPREEQDRLADLYLGLRADLKEMQKEVEFRRELIAGLLEHLQ